MFWRRSRPQLPMNLGFVPWPEKTILKRVSSTHYVVVDFVPPQLSELLSVSPLSRAVADRASVLFLQYDASGKLTFATSHQLFGPFEGSEDPTIHQPSGTTGTSCECVREGKPK